MQILDWTLVLLILLGSVLFLIREFRKKAKGKKTCECSGCVEAGCCSSKEGILTELISDQSMGVATDKRN